MLTTGELGRLLGVTPITIINWMEAGKLPFERIHERGRRRIRECDVQAFVLREGIDPARLDPELWSRVLEARESPDDAPALFFTVRDFVCVHWSSQAQGLLGWSPGDVLGTRLESVRARVPGMDVDLRTLAELPPIEGNTLELHIEMLHRKGHWLAITLTLNWIHGPNGSIEGVAFVCQPGA
ncbi:MAG: Helix-turn-helix domain [Fibrobacterota bacterium]